MKDHHTISNYSHKDSNKFLFVMKLSVVRLNMRCMFNGDRFLFFRVNNASNQKKTLLVNEYFDRIIVANTRLKTILSYKLDSPKRLRCTRNNLHLNLFSAILLRCVLHFIKHAADGQG
ncbi:unnamed protein product, partial [Schistosoma turkestanicum]